MVPKNGVTPSYPPFCFWIFHEINHAEFSYWGTPRDSMTMENPRLVLVSHQYIPYSPMIAGEFPLKFGYHPYGTYGYGSKP